MSRFHTRMTCAIFTSVGAFVMVALPSGTPGFGGGAASAKDPYECLTDDGYGRKRSCSASYKSANPNWRGGDDCFTDDGYGRFRSCSASYKAKHQLQTKTLAK
jgi:hypothetical protein